MSGTARPVVAVTGASSGVGRAVCRALARTGARVGLIARGPEALEATAGEVRGLGGEALVLPLDVADAEAVDRAAEQLVARWGRLDVWINNAMLSVFAPVSQIRPDEYRRVTEVTYLGYVHGTLAALKQMRPQHSGTIVQIGSALAYRSIPLQSAYCAAKAAIRGFTDSLHSELIHERSRIRLMSIHLPAVNTPQFEVVRNRLVHHPRPVGRIFQPELIADAVVRALRRPRRELWLGGPTVQAIVGQRLFPGLLDHYLARVAWDGQQTSTLPRHEQDNLDAPLPGDRGARGAFSGEARRRSAAIWLSTHRGTALLLAGALLLAAARRRR